MNDREELIQELMKNPIGKDETKKQERPSLKERLAQKKDIIAKNEANREPRQMHKDRGAQALT